LFLEDKCAAPEGSYFTASSVLGKGNDRFAMLGGIHQRLIMGFRFGLRNFFQLIKLQTQQNKPFPGDRRNQHGGDSAGFNCAGDVVARKIPGADRYGARGFNRGFSS
jgi:hypothetical protein